MVRLEGAKGLLQVVGQRRPSLGPGFQCKRLERPEAMALLGRSAK